MTDPEKAALLGQCIAMRNVLEGVIASLESEPLGEDCPHPVEQRQYTEGGTMGSGSAFTCGQCHTVVAGSDGSIDLSRLVRPTKE